MARTYEDTLILPECFHIFQHMLPNLAISYTSLLWLQLLDVKTTTCQESLEGVQWANHANSQASQNCGIGPQSGDDVVWLSANLKSSLADMRPQVSIQSSTGMDCCCGLRSRLSNAAPQILLSKEEAPKGIPLQQQDHQLHVWRPVDLLHRLSAPCPSVCLSEYYGLQKIEAALVWRCRAHGRELCSSLSYHPQILSSLPRKHVPSDQSGHDWPQMMLSSACKRTNIFILCQE